MPVTRACHLLGVSVSGFYAWRNSDKEHRFGVVHTDAFILETLKAEIKTVTKSYVPGVLVCYRLLRQKGISIDIKRLRRLMRADGLFHRFHRNYVCTTDSEHDLPKAPNLTGYQCFKKRLMRMNNPMQVVFFIAIKALNTVAKLFKKHCL